jgi:hypothetical protein
MTASIATALAQSGKSLTIAASKARPCTVTSQYRSERDGSVVRWTAGKACTDKGGQLRVSEGLVFIQGAPEAVIGLVEQAHEDLLFRRGRQRKPVIEVVSER